MMLQENQEKYDLMVNEVISMNQFIANANSKQQNDVVMTSGRDNFSDRTSHTGLKRFGKIRNSGVPSSKFGLVERNILTEVSEYHATRLWFRRENYYRIRSGSVQPPSNQSKQTLLNPQVRLMKHKQKEYRLVQSCSILTTPAHQQSSISANVPSSGRLSMAQNYGTGPQPPASPNKSWIQGLEPINLTRIVFPPADSNSRAPTNYSLFLAK